MAKTRATNDRGPLNKFAISRLIQNAEQLHGEGLLDDNQLRTVLASIEARRMPGAGNGLDEIENAKANLDAGASTL